ncbi:MAG: hypothetical protein GF317_13215 [Candidatus Lokiarchaeota archaeon]|nr:hypothetical protein [Candidatus Lokiarchaeota archaeon]MBD3200596.1 hypothetical protein [Candidatus Lokiarchaeota archaeon]
MGINSMSISDEFVEIIHIINDRIKLPPIEEVFFPSVYHSNLNKKVSNFGAIKLKDGSIGIIYANLTNNIKKNASEIDLQKFSGDNPLELSKNFTSKDNFQKTLALGCINAISQHLLRLSNYKLDFTTDSLGYLQIENDDMVGMVGFFPPLVKKLENANTSLIIIEKRERLVQKNERWKVSLDPSELESCNKILCTATTILNESIDNILSYCKNAEKFSIIGPTAGFLPDPIFSRGVDVVGGTYITHPSLFMELIKKNEKWGPATRKYCLQKPQYPGFKSLLDDSLLI